MQVSQCIFITGSIMLVFTALFIVHPVTNANWKLLWYYVRSCAFGKKCWMGWIRISHAE